MAKTLDAQVEAVRTRTLDAGPYTFVWLDAPRHPPVFASPE